MVRSSQAIAVVIASATSIACSSEDTATTGGTHPDAGTGCVAGELEGSDGSCVAAGPAAAGCADGFTTDDAGGCMPLLPDEECAAGQMALPGDSGCHPIAPCGDGAWGDIPVDASTQHVDGSYGLDDSDGSAARPWRSIGEAIAAAEPGAIVAVAQGSYAESASLQGKAVRLWGRCPELVEIEAPGGSFAAVVVTSDAAEIRGLALTGAGAGVAISGAQDVIVERVWVHDTAAFGIDVERGFGAATVSVAETLVERARDVGVFVIGVEATLTRSVVRDTRPGTDAPGRGLGVQPEAGGSQPGVVTASGCVVSGNVESGVYVAGSQATLEGSVVRRTQPKSDGLGGRGLNVQPGPAAERATLVVRRSVVQDSRDAGILVMGSDATIESTVVQRTDVKLATGGYGNGIVVELDEGSGARSTLDLRGSLLADNHECGLLVTGSDATVTSTVVRGTGASSGSFFGDGIAVVSYGAAASATVAASVIASNLRAGVAAFGGEAALRASLLDCNPIHLAAEVYQGSSPTFDDQGGNVCGCDGALDTCAALTSSLAPPTPVDR